MEKVQNCNFDLREIAMQSHWLNIQIYLEKFSCVV